MSGIVVEELVSKLGLTIDPEAMEVLASFQHAVHKGLLALAAGGAAVVGIFGEMVISTAEAGAQIALASEKLGINAQALQELKYAADQSNVSFESLTTGLKFLSKNAGEARQGSTELQAAFAGIKTTDAKGHLLAVDDLLTNVVDHFQKIPKGAEQTTFAIKVFGRSGVDMVPMLKKGSAGLAELREEAYSLGVVLDKEAIEASEHFEHSLKKLKSALTGLRNTFSAPFIEGFAETLDTVIELLKAGQPFVRRLAAAFKDLGRRIKLVIDVFVNLGKWVAKLFNESGLKGIFAAINALKLLESVLIGLGVIMATTAALAVADWFLAAAPFILIAALIGLIVDDIANWIKGNKSLTGDILGSFATISGKIHEVTDLLRDFYRLLFNPDGWNQMSLNGKKAALVIAKIFESLSNSAWNMTHPFSAPRTSENSKYKTAESDIELEEMITNASKYGGVMASKFGPHGPTPDNATGPGTLGGGSVVHLKQENHIEIHGTNMGPEETKKTLEEVLERHHRQAAAAISGGN